MSDTSSPAPAPQANPPEVSPAGRIVHEILWSEALPWWILFRAAGAAFSPTVILLAALGALATWAGWSLADRMHLAGGGNSHPWTLSVAEQPFRQPTTSTAGNAEGFADRLPPLPTADGPLLGLRAGGDRLLVPSRTVMPGLLGVIERLPSAAGDVLRLASVPFRPSATTNELIGALARLGWFVLVWSIFGTAITRHVALSLIGEDAPGLSGAVSYGTRKWTSSFNAVAFVLLGILVLSVPGALLGLLMRSDLGLALAGAVWPLVLAGAVVLASLAVGVLAGWPLMVAAVGVERGDSFQAISTAFSYLYQRPLHYAFYGLVAALVAIPALAAAGVFADAVGTLAMWAASFGMGHERTAAVMNAIGGGGSAAAAPWGARAIGFWMRGLETLLSSFGWGYFWAIATAAYLLLRQDVDGTEVDEVVLEEPVSGS